MPNQGVANSGPVISGDARFIRLATTASFASLFSYAMMLFITPASNNEILREFSVTVAHLALLPLTMMAGFFVAVIWAGAVSDKRGKLPLMLGGTAIMAIGALIFSLSPIFKLTILASMLMGIGGGMAEGTSMALISDLFEGRRRTSMVNLSQAMFGVGAITSPLGIGLLLNEEMSWRIGYVGAAALCAVSAFVVLMAYNMRQEKPVGLFEEGPGWRSLITDRLILLLSLGIALYVGAEIGQSNWLAVYFERGLGANAALAAASLSFMWLGLTVGRITTAWASCYMSESTIIRVSLISATVLQTALLLLSTPIPGALVVFGLGFFLGPVFPTIVSSAGKAYPSASGTATSIVVAAGSLGAAIFPPGIGGLAGLVGMREALWACVALLVVDSGLFIFLRRS